MTFVVDAIMDWTDWTGTSVRSLKPVSFGVLIFFVSSISLYYGISTLTGENITCMSLSSWQLNTDECLTGVDILLLGSWNDSEKKKKQWGLRNLTPVPQELRSLHIEYYSNIQARDLKGQLATSISYNAIWLLVNALVSTVAEL